MWATTPQRWSCFRPRVGRALCLVVAPGCARSSNDLSVQPVDGKKAAAVLSERRVVIPEVFTFVDGLTRPVDFVGKPDFYMRFDREGTHLFVIAAGT